MKSCFRLAPSVLCAGLMLCGSVSALDEAAPAETSEPQFSEFLEWLNELHDHSTALRRSPPQGERIRHLREIAFLLGERGLTNEAERALTLALGSSEGDAGLAFSDSLHLAELRVQSGRVQEALSIAQRLPIQDLTPEEMLRVAAIHSAVGSPYAALRILDDFLPQDPSEWSVETKFLFARCLWESGAVEKSLLALDDLLRDAALPESIEESSILLRADCLYALSRFQEANEEYQRAARLDLVPLRAAWVRLQLGNLAYRQGELEAAMQLYREASESWPDTYYAAQAEWLYRAAERIGSAKKEAERSG